MLEINDTNYSNFAQSQLLFYMHQQAILLHYGTQYTENQSSHHGEIHDDRVTDGLIDGWSEPFPVFRYT